MRTYLKITLQMLAVAGASLFALHAFGDTGPSPTPSGPAAGGWIAGQGGYMAAVLSMVVAFNIVCTAAHQLCQRLKLAEPPWLQAAGSWGEKIIGYLTANTQSPPEQK